MAHLIVFDLDGTLVDSRRDLADSANELLVAHGAAPLRDEEVGRMVGEGARVLVERVLAARGLAVPIADALASFLDIYERRIVVHTRPYAGIRSMLDALSGRAVLAVLTNKPTHHTALLLAALDLARYFDRTIGGDGPHPKKPDPAGLNELIAWSGATAATTLMVGDSMVDAETARRAGTRLCLVEYGYGSLDAGATADPRTLVAGNPTDLPAAVMAFLRS
jgi:phosphoglycolate phosphatase